MQSRMTMVTFIFAAIVGLALAAGVGAAKAYKDIALKARATPLASLQPLPAWATEPLPDFSRYTDTQERKQAFFDFLFPRVALANQQVLALRNRVESLSDQESLAPSEEAFLDQQAERLRVEAPVGSEESFEALTHRLDIIPPSLVLAQAANESAWGTSRFAREGNNLFGQWCFSPGCGLVPANRTEGAEHEVATFESPYQSVRSYITNLNRHPEYADLRNDREQLREENRMPTGPALAPGLAAYSERGNDYIEEILGMMRTNKLHRYDRLFGEWVEIAAQADEPYVLLINKQASLATD